MFLDDNEFDHDFESNFANSKYNKYIESKIIYILLCDEMNYNLHSLIKI